MLTLEPYWALKLAGVVVAALALACACSESPTGGDATPVGPSCVTISQADTVLRQGDVLTLSASVAQPCSASGLVWSATNGYLSSDGRFVGYGPGSARVIVASAASGAADTLRLGISPRGLGGRSFRLLGHGSVSERFTSDLWVMRSPVDGRDYAYTGTWAGVAPLVDSTRAPGNVLKVWDVTNPGAILLTDSLVVPAFTVGDVGGAVSGLVGVFPREFAGGGQGITIFDPTPDPAHPQVREDFTQGFVGGVHTAEVATIAGATYAFAAATEGPRILHIIRVDPAPAQRVATWGSINGHVHDTFVRDGLAFVSSYSEGLFILDVGNGVVGGSPSAPRQVSRIGIAFNALGMNVHNAWRWGRYVFVGHEQVGLDRQTGSSAGYIAVVDISDLSAPFVTARFEVPGAGPHNFWVDESRAILYAAYYNAGVLAIDVSGELLGSLDLQGRLIAQVRPGDSVGQPTFVWGVQLHQDHLFITDMNTGLWAAEVP